MTSTQAAAAAPDYYWTVFVPQTGRLITLAQTNIRRFISHSIDVNISQQPWSYLVICQVKMSYISDFRFFQVRIRGLLLLQIIIGPLWTVFVPQTGRLITLAQTNVRRFINHSIGVNIGQQPCSYLVIC